MVRKADLVITAKVTAQKPEWTTRNGQRSIVTKTTFQVIETHKGSPAPTVELSLPGGTIGDTTLEMVGLPQFEIGETSILFIRTNSAAGAPIVGIYHGKLRISKDADSKEEILLRHNGKPLKDVSEIGKEETDEPSAAAAHSAATKGAKRLKLREFKEHVRKHLSNEGTK